MKKAAVTIVKLYVYVHVSSLFVDNAIFTKYLPFQESISNVEMSEQKSTRRRRRVSVEERVKDISSDSAKLLYNNIISTMQDREKKMTDLNNATATLLSKRQPRGGNKVHEVNINATEDCTESLVFKPKNCEEKEDCPPQLESMDFVESKESAKCVESTECSESANGIEVEQINPNVNQS